VSYLSISAQNILYIGKNIELVEALLSTLSDENEKNAYHIEHRTCSNEIIRILHEKKYHHLITEQSVCNAVSANIQRLFPALKTTYLNQNSSHIVSPAEPSFNDLASESVKNALNCISIPVYYKDESGKIIVCNHSFAKSLGLTTDEVIGKSGADILPSSLKDDLQAVDKKMFDDRQVQLYECELYDLDGRCHEVVFRKEFIASTDIQVGIVFDVSELNEARREIEKEHIMLRAATDTSPDLVFFKDLESRFLGCNKEFERFIGCSEKEILGKTDDQLFGLEQATMCQQQDQQVMGNNVVYTGEEYLNNVSGERHFVEMQKVPLLDDQQKIRGLIGIGRDITAQHRLQKRLKVADTVFENSQENIVVTDQAGKIISINKAACSLLGYPKSKLQGQPIEMLCAQEDSATLLQDIDDKLSLDGIWKGDISYRNQFGDISFAWLDIYVVELEKGLNNHVYSFTDLCQNKDIESKIQFLSTHDPLTGLSNRIALFAKLDDAIHRANFNESAMAVLLIGINGFKVINDQYGHNQGDKVLQEIAARLRNCIFEKDTLARFGNDEFVIVIDALNNEHGAALVAQKISNQFKKPFKIGEIEATLGVTVGISLSPDDGADVDTLLQSAEKAMLRGKRDKSSCYRFYTEQLTEHSSHQLKLEAELKTALQEDQFELYYQPQFDLNKKLIIGVESLLRWNHPQHGVVFPDRFLSLAEESGLIVPLGLKTLEKAVQQTVIWRKSNIFFGRIAVPLSLKQLEQISLIADIQTVFKEVGGLVSDIEFEVFERSFTSENYTVHENLFNINKLGIAITVAGFGADIPVFHFIEPLGIDKFKIAKDYVQHIPGSLVGQAMIKSVLVLARELGVDVVGEMMDVCDEDFINDSLMNTKQHEQAKPMRASEATFYLRCHKKK